MSQFADIIVPLPLPRLFTYAIPEGAGLTAGKRVLVPLGRRKIYTGVVAQVHSEVPVDYKAREIIGVLDPTALIGEKQLDFWMWIADYYVCSVGEVMAAALPAGLKLESETRVRWTSGEAIDPEELTDHQFLVAQALERQDELSLAEIAEIIGQVTVHSLIGSMMDRGWIEVVERVEERYRSKTKILWRLAFSPGNDDLLKQAFQAVAQAPKQRTALFHMLDDARALHPGRTANEWQKSFGLSRAILNGLRAKGIAQSYEHEITRLSFGAEGKERSRELNTEQQKALEAIRKGLSGHQVQLLHGVTGSGKTELYIHLIREALEQGEQVLYLLPEIALTTQIIQRLKKYFGDQVGVFHSHYSQNERTEVWQAVVRFPDRNSYPIVLGARSAVFLPFQKLGLVIVDEEHESGFKQFDPAPRYHGRDAAVYLARLHGAKCLLGPPHQAWRVSTTPAPASTDMFPCRNALATFRCRRSTLLIWGSKNACPGQPLILSEVMKKKIANTLSEEGQVILFQNRRGFAPIVECQRCGWAPQCQNCDVSLTYHKHIHTLKCHYCGSSQQFPKKCGTCGHTELRTRNFGTERIEEELRLRFPSARVGRMDWDTTRRKYAYQDIIDRFARQEINILVGTQMLTKGLDFDHVRMVGILAADTMMQYPDFRAFERAFQLMVQVAGRAGRKKERGQVYIQSYKPKHPLLLDVQRSDYGHRAEEELKKRKNFHYPPYYRLIRLNVRHRKIDLVNRASEALARPLRKRFPREVLGPEFPAIARVRNQYHKNILLKLATGESLQMAKELIRQLIEQLKDHGDFKGVRIVADVDPQ